LKKVQSLGAASTVTERLFESCSPDSQKLMLDGIEVAHTVASLFAYAGVRKNGVRQMTEFVVVETDQGLAILKQPMGADPLETAASHGALLMDGGPYRSFEEAYDVMIDIPIVAEEEADRGADQDG
jgi:hypothetical protein